MSSVVLAARRAPAGKGCRPCPAYLCHVGRMTADPSMPASGRLPRVGSAMLAGQLSGARGRGGQVNICHISSCMQVWLCGMV
ncbi:hypothetical protein B296_00006051 [Ensete ventricosum]|uniref:Uncharacterized protein n=1 Tax=Ensete ventricosum TaxID=4639 RepID=A0A427B8S5_ENSVE|nr:hypothetical protein B296_00006051 [Ensete ventricosum]